jgi:thioester reductase-like protein
LPRSNAGIGAPAGIPKRNRVAPTRVLLTGVTGFLGRELLYQLLTETRADVTCLVRAADQEEASSRLAATLVELFGADGPDAVAERVRAVRGDVTRPALGLSRSVRAGLIRTTTHVVHGAATVRFDLEIGAARRINGGGTMAVLEFARDAHRRGHLARLVYVSTAFVGGRHPEPFGEDDLDVGQRFRNTYEQSKFEAEQLVHAAMREVPITIVRPSIVIGDSRSGATSAFNVIYWPLRVFADGLLRFAPAAPNLPVDVVPVDYVARGTIEALFEGEADNTYALAAGDRASDAQGIGAIAARAFGVAPPRFVSGPLGRLMLPVMSSAAVVGPWRHFGKAGRQYLPYFRHGSRFDTRHASDLLRPRGIEPPLAAQLLEPVLEFARSTNFGRDRATIAARQRTLSQQRRHVLANAAL